MKYKEKNNKNSYVNFYRWRLFELTYNIKSLAEVLSFQLFLVQKCDLDLDVKANRS